MALIGTSPSATSRCSSYPIQLVVWPLALRLVPTAQCFGKSASIAARLMLAWRSRRRGSFVSTTSPFLGRARLRLRRAGVEAAGGALFTGFSRASIAVASREMWPTRRSLYACLISASWRRHGSALRANSAKAREKVVSLGSSPRCSQPHSRRNGLSTVSRSINIAVVGSPITALATKARANAARSQGGRPGKPGQTRTKASTPATSSAVTTRLFEQFHVVMNPDALTKVIEEFDHGEGLLGCPVGRDIEW